MPAAQGVGAATRAPLRRRRPQAAVDRAVEAELLEAAEGDVDLLLGEQQHELVAQARRRQVADEVHLEQARARP